MKTLVDMINESGITNAERSYREFCQMCIARNVDPKEVAVRETSRHNWQIFKGTKKLFLVSRYILNDAVIEQYGIEKLQ